MTFIIPESDYRKQISDSIQNRLDFEYTTRGCVHCGFPMKIPLMVKSSDIQKINQFIEILDGYLNKHPEIAGEMMKDLLTTIIGAKHKN